MIHIWSVKIAFCPPMWLDEYAVYRVKIDGSFAFSDGFEQTGKAEVTLCANIDVVSKLEGKNAGKRKTMGVRAAKLKTMGVRAAKLYIS